MSLREEIEPYLDSDGLVKLDRDRGSNNGVLYTSLYYITLVNLGLATLEDRARFEKTIERLSVEPGLINRSSTCQDLEACDDYIGLTTASYLLKSRIAEEVLAYGEEHEFIFNNKSPGTLQENGRINLSSFLGRNPSFVAHLHFAAGEMPSPLLRGVWALAIWMSGRGKPQDQDARLLSWLLIEAMDGRSDICDAAARSWRKRLAKEWPGGMKSVVAACLGNPSHPIARYFVE